jgi:hypothetical protein
MRGIGPRRGRADILAISLMEFVNGHPYASATFALLTQHAKEEVVAPALGDGLGARLEVVGDFDTDTLGTFTRDVARAGSQIEAARRKAAIAIERSGASLGLGSEGAFVSGPFGLGSWNVERIVLIDASRGIEVVGRAAAAGLHAYRAVATRAELESVAEWARFPGHGLVVRPDGADDPRVRKGIRDWSTLESAFDEARRLSAGGVAFVESDLRAHMHPTRMSVIAQAARDLVERLRTPCPGCRMPGFGSAEPVPGLPCAACGAPTRAPVAEEWRCVACGRREERPIAGGSANRGSRDLRPLQSLSAFRRGAVLRSVARRSPLRGRGGGGGGSRAHGTRGAIPRAIALLAA